MRQTSPSRGGVMGLPMARRPSQGPLDYAETVIAFRNDLKASILGIVKLYISLRYAENDSKDDVRRLKLLVKQFKP